MLGCGSSHQYGFASLRAVHSSFRLKMLSWKRIVAFNLFTLFMAVCFLEICDAEKRFVSGRFQILLKRIRNVRASEVCTD